MRLWHYKLIPYLPKKQLQGQWRELNSIFKNENRHILINYVYDYPKDYLFDYTCVVRNEMSKRNIKIKSYENCSKYFENLGVIRSNKEFNFPEHDNEYLTICYWNLREKYIRGQKDFDADTWNKLDKFYKKEILK